MIKFTVVFIILIAFSFPAQARHHHYHQRTIQTDINIHDPRPHAWCGYFMRHLLGVADKSYNLARNWAHFGSPSGGPAVGIIVVWPHHVGIITSRAINGSGWVIKSGNDANAVRERERSVRGAIAFRWPSKMAGL